MMKKKLIILIYILLNILCYSAIDISKEWDIDIEGKKQKSDMPFYKTGYIGRIELKKKITLEEETPIYLYLSKMDDEDTVYFNGEEVGRTPIEWNGKYNYKSYYFIDRIYVVPKSLIINGENEIKIVINNVFGGGGLYGDKYLIYREKEFQSMYRANIINKIDKENMIYFIMSGIFFAIGIKYITDFIFYKKESESFYFAIIMMIFSLFALVEMPQREMIFPFSSYYISKLDFSLMILIVTTTSIFVKEYFRLKEKRGIMILNIINIISIVAILILKDMKSIHLVFNTWISFLIIQLIMYIGFLTTNKNAKRDNLIRVGFIIWFVTVIYDISYFYRIINLFDRYISMYGQFVFGFILIISMAKKSYMIKMKVDNMTLELEKSIKVKTKNIEEINSKLMDSMEEIKAKEELLIRNEKLAILGEMAGEITHEIKNPLSAILTNMQIMKMDLETLPKNKITAELMDSVEIVEEAAKQSKNIIANILTYARMESSATKEIDLSMVTESAINIIKKDIEKSGISINTKFEYGVIIEGKSGEIMQAVLNFLINSKDALIEKEQRIKYIDIKVYSKNKYAVMEIEDNGKGMSEEERERIFEPYFTTKKDGKGTGIGMSVTQTILNRHNAEVEIESELWIGTKFIIKFPKK
jgi:signal transduction histidine kinase